MSVQTNPPIKPDSALKRLLDSFAKEHWSIRLVALFIAVLPGIVGGLTVVGGIVWLAKRHLDS